MDPIEKAIRTALEKGDAEDPDFRERVYLAVRGALDRAIQANPQLTVERAIARRRALQEKIAEIEAEFALALAEDPAAIEGSLDDALLDILARSPISTDRRDAAPMPEWPSAGDEPAAQPVPSVVAVGPPGQAVPPPPESRIEPPRFEQYISAARDPVSEPARREAGDVWMDDAAMHAGAGVAPEVSARPAPPVVASPARQPPPPDGATLDRISRADPSLDVGVVPQVAGRLEPELDFPAAMPPAFDVTDINAPVPASPPEIAAVDRKARSRERRRPFAAVFLGIALLSLVAAGVMFAMQTGLLKSPADRDTSVPNPPADIGSEDFDPGAGGGIPPLTDQPPSAQSWITVFSPSDPATASAPAGTQAEAMQDDTGAFLRIRSSSNGSAVVFDVGQGVLEQLAGKKAVFNVTARAEEGKDTEISIECNFGELGDCGRRRYEVGYSRGDFLFEITLPDKRPGASGTIAINSDFSEQGKAIDVYEIKAAVQ